MVGIVEDATQRLALRLALRLVHYSAGTHLRIISLVMELQWTSLSLLANRRSAADVSGQFQRLPKSLYKCSIVNSEVKRFAHLTIIFKVHAVLLVVGLPTSLKPEDPTVLK